MTIEPSGPGPIVLGAHNARLKRLRRLIRQSKVRSSERAFVVEGPTLVADALASPLMVEAVYLGAGHGLDLLAPQLEQVGASLDSVPVYSVDDDVLATVLDASNPRPVAAVVELPTADITDIDHDLPILVAVELADPGNLGTVIRTAEAAGFGGVVVVGRSVDHLNPKAVRAAAGSTLRLPVVAFDSAEDAISAIRAGGRSLVATVVDPSAVPYDLHDLASVAVLIGNEPHGLGPDLVAAADAVVTIPMADGVESLNVGAAAAVLAFEVARQRRHGLGPSAPTAAAEQSGRTEKLAVKRPSIR